jgi:hypothetical protein
MPTEIDPDDRMVGPKYVAEWLEIPQQTLYQWRRERKGPRAVVVGRHLRYRIGDVRKWLEELGGEGE